MMRRSDSEPVARPEMSRRGPKWHDLTPVHQNRRNEATAKRFLFLPASGFARKMRPSGLSSRGTPRASFCGERETEDIAL